MKVMLYCSKIVRFIQNINIFGYVADYVFVFLLQDRYLSTNIPQNLIDTAINWSLFQV